jgi:DNA-binding transcriptional regulator WhiA
MPHVKQLQLHQLQIFHQQMALGQVAQSLVAKMSEQVLNHRLSMQDQCNVFALFFSVLPQS